MGWNVTGPSVSWIPREWECKLGPDTAFLKFHFSPGGAFREMNLTLKFLPLFFFSSLEKKIKIKGAIMQHILSEVLQGEDL